MSKQYRIYVLRLWRDDANDPWRMAIQPSRASTPRGLPSLAALTAYVQAEIEDASQQAPAQPPRDESDG